MYDELVKRLRELHPEEFGNQWDFAFACQQAMHEAADAIEELIGFVQEAERDRDEYRERLDKSNDAIEVMSEYVNTIRRLKCEGWYLQQTKFHNGYQALTTMPLPLPQLPKGEEK